MAAEELRSGVYHDVCAVLQRTDEIRCAEGVVDDEGDAVLVGHSSHTFKVEHVAVGVAEGLGIYYFCVGLDSGLQGVEVVDVDNRIRNALRSQRMGNQVVRTTIQVVGRNDMVASLHDVLQSVGDGSSTRGDSQSGYTTLEGSHAVFEYTLRRVGQATIDITCIAQTKAVGSML